MNEKKTAKEIISLLTVGGYAEHGKHLYDVGEIIDAMQEYAAQETADSIQAIDSLTKKIAELMHENERLKEALKATLSISERWYNMYKDPASWAATFEDQDKKAIENAKKLTGQI